MTKNINTIKNWIVQNVEYWSTTDRNYSPSMFQIKKRIALKWHRNVELEEIAQAINSLRNDDIVNVKMLNDKWNSIEITEGTGYMAYKTAKDDMASDKINEEVKRALDILNNN